MIILTIHFSMVINYNKETFPVWWEYQSRQMYQFITKAFLENGWDYWTLSNRAIPNPNLKTFENFAVLSSAVTFRLNMEELDKEKINTIVDSFAVIFGCGNSVNYYTAEY